MRISSERIRIDQIQPPTAIDQPPVAIARRSYRAVRNCLGLLVVYCVVVSRFRQPQRYSGVCHRHRSWQLVCVEPAHALEHPNHLPAVLRSPRLRSLDSLLAMVYRGRFPRHGGRRLTHRGAGAAFTRPQLNLFPAFDLTADRRR